MIDPASIAQGVVSGLVTERAIRAANKAVSTLTGKGGQPDKQDIMIYLLARLVSIQEPQEKGNIDIPVALQPAPYEYLIDENWMGKSHLCMFVPVQFPLQIMTEGGGLYQKNVGPGWVQVDLRGRMTSGDANNHNVILSYRDDALGTGV